MRILFVTDLHGNTRKYDRLLSAALEFQAQVVINGGDMLPKEGNPFSQGDFINDYLSKHFAHFDTAGITYLCSLGNDDLMIYDPLFDEVCEMYPYVINLAQRKIELNGFEFVGMNWVVDYPFRLKDRCRMDTLEYTFQEQYGSGLLSSPYGWSEIDDWFSYAATLPTIEDEINSLVRPVDMKQCIYVIHMPPHKLGLDHCGNELMVGSKALYDFFRLHQPRLTLHGHIHESPARSGRWLAQLGRTICIQPGQIPPLTYVTGDLQTMEFERNILG